MVPLDCIDVGAYYLSISKAWWNTESLEDGLTRYISTRGEAPTLGFCDVMLAGLARDGGLYVPETWPHFSAGPIGRSRSM
jgi:hypothetical protein